MTGEEAAIVDDLCGFVTCVTSVLFLKSSASATCKIVMAVARRPQKLV